MKRVIQICDRAAFVLFGVIFGIITAAAFAALAFFKKKRHGAGPVNELSFAVFDLISNKYSSMFEDALLNGYISKHHYIYLDFNNRYDRFEKMEDKIFFYSVAAHPDNTLYNSGFTMMSMLFTELKILAAAFRIARRENISFVKAHDPHLLGFNGLMVSRWFRLPCVLHMNSDFGMKYRGTGKVSAPIFISRGLEKLFESAIINSYDIVMADRKFYSKSASFPKRSLRKYRAFGVRVERLHYSDPDSRKDLKGAMGLDNKKILLYVGRLHPVKYPEDALKALAIIRRSVGDAVLLVAGSGILEEPLKEMARREGLQESVIFLGPKKYEELIDILYTADLLLAPHGGVTLVESALASTPIVTYDFDWHGEFLEDGKMGYIVPFRDVRTMAEKAVDILKDESLRLAMGDYCRKAAVSGYSRERSIENEKTIYDSLMSI
ncbi:MAG: glycosyltransferase [Candidatus Omnitrophica bacterium]|nr:glycosyltransferase [Candidatus Omnitrophota bacterium]